MPSLAIFDFDRTIVDYDSDATIINKVKEHKVPTDWESSNCNWCPFMDDIFKSAYDAGICQQDILNAIGDMKPTPGCEELIKILYNNGWEIIIISDANSVFIRHWLLVHGLDDLVMSVITNRAYFKNGRMHIEPCMRQSTCKHCASNLCKSVALGQWCAERPPYDRLLYVGDGRNDFCPTTNLPPNAIVFPRRDYPLDKLIKKTLESPNPQVKCRVVPWDDHYSIQEELFPKSTSIEQDNN